MPCEYCDFKSLLNFKVYFLKIWFSQNWSVRGYVDMIILR